MHRLLRIVSVALITAGLVVAADIAITLAWKEPLSTIYGSLRQDEAADELERLEGEFPTAADLREATGKAVAARARLLAGLFSALAETGEGIGRIRIDAIEQDAVFVEGTDTASLRKGPGRYPDTAFPGEGRTIGIAGHRTTYLAPFRHIDEIDRGDEILLEMPYGTFTYEVERERVVEPTQGEIVRDVGYERLVLTACHPLYSAAQRYAIFARLARTDLAGAA